MYKIRLRPFEEGKDTIRLYSYMMKPENQILFSHKFMINSLMHFDQWIHDKLQKTFHDFFIIENKAGEAIGFTYSYDFFQNDGHCKFTLCLFEEAQNKGYGVVAAYQMLDYLFSSYSVNQVFTCVFDYNKRSLKLNKSCGFNEVGVLPNYRFYNGKYFSLHYLCMERGGFYEKCRQYPKLTSKN